MAYRLPHIRDSTREVLDRLHISKSITLFHETEYESRWTATYDFVRSHTYIYAILNKKRSRRHQVNCSCSLIIVGKNIFGVLMEVKHKTQWWWHVDKTNGIFFTSTSFFLVPTVVQQPFRISHEAIWSYDSRSLAKWMKSKKTEKPHPISNKKKQ